MRYTCLYLQSQQNKCFFYNLRNLYFKSLNKCIASTLEPKHLFTKLSLFYRTFSFFLILEEHLVFGQEYHYSRQWKLCSWVLNFYLLCAKSTTSRKRPVDLLHQIHRQVNQAVIEAIHLDLNLPKDKNDIEPVHGQRVTTCQAGNHHPWCWFPFF